MSTISKITVGSTQYDIKDTTYSVATTSANGLMSSTDKSKLNNLPTTFGTLLWSNSNTSVVFSPQTVSIDLSSYNFVLIYYNFDKDNGWGHSMIIPKGSYNVILGPAMLDYATTTRIRRITSVTNSGIVFSDGYVGTAINQNACIPSKIYGIK